MSATIDDLAEALRRRRCSSAIPDGCRVELIVKK
jgi:hypothetical protein